MELSLPHMLNLFNIFHAYDGKENCAKMLEEECIKMFGTKSLKREFLIWPFLKICFPIWCVGDTRDSLLFGCRLFEREHLHPMPPTD